VPILCSQAKVYISNHVETSFINYKGDRVVVPSLQHLGSAVMNVTGAISEQTTPTLEVTKDNHSMPKLSGPW